MGLILRERKLDGGRKSLLIEYNIDGKRRYEFLNIILDKDKIANREKRRLARAIKIKRENEIIQNNYELPNFAKSKINVVDYYDRAVKERPKDRPAWINSHLKFKKFSNGRIRFNEITADWLREYQKYLLSEVSQNTAHHYYANLRTVLNKAVNEDIIHANPCNKIKGIPLKEVKREYLTKEELTILSKTECSNSEVKRAFLFSCFTGLRLSDIYNLKWENINGSKIEFRQKKTGSLEYLPMNDTADKLLRMNTLEKIVPLPSTNIFKLPTKSPLTQIIKAWVKKAKIEKKISFHNARHTFATQALINGADLYTVSKLLGHKDISTTQVYAKVVDESKQKAVDLLPTISI